TFTGSFPRENIFVKTPISFKFEQLGWLKDWLPRDFTAVSSFSTSDLLEVAARINVALFFPSNGSKSRAATHVRQPRSFHPTARRQPRHDQNPRAEHQRHPGDQFVRSNHFERHWAGKFFANAYQLCHQRSHRFQTFLNHAER